MARQIRSHLPGVFYRSPSPEDPPFKSDGDAVAAGEVVGLIEVMKTFHELKAEEAGTIASFLIDNEDPVTAGQAVAEFTD